MTLVVIDYGRGNLFSIGQALRHLDQPFEVSHDPETILKADRLILPGVGAFGDAMANLRERDLVAPIQEAALKGTPLLGICLGKQMLCESSEEFGDHPGLALIPGKVEKLPENVGGSGLTRIPNVGWRTLKVNDKDTVLTGLAEDAMAYFVHSYAARPTYPDHLAASIDFNGHQIAAAIHRENVMGFQFHPEKSAALGLELIRRFLVL